MERKNNLDEQASVQLADIAKELVRQNRSRTRWRVFFFIVIAGYFGWLSYLGALQSGVLEDALQKEEPFLAEVSLSGIIHANGDVNLDDAEQLLTEAFAAENARAVIVRLNSPGGSPVQARQIYQTIVRLKKEHGKKIYAVVEDVCASGCYYIAAGADKIYADELSIVGSIGVAMPGFGFVALMEKLGVERRLYTAGKYKGMLDSFSAENDAVRAHVQQNILDLAHQSFIATVRAERGEKLVAHPDLFSGLFWLGSDAENLGLVDEIGNSNSISKLTGIESRVIFEKQKSLLEQLTETSAKQISLFFERKFQSGFLPENLQ